MRHVCQRTINHSVRAVLLSGAAMAITAVPAMAQEAPAPAGASSTPNETIESDGDIIVTAPNYVPSGSMSATKTDAPLIETPQSVSVISRDQIDLLNFIDVQQAVRYTSGVVGENYGPDLRFDFLTLRGFAPIQYIDGLQAPISTTISNIGVDLYGYESIDILKGPSSVLYGTTPPGGIYNLTSRRPSKTFGGEIGVRYGSDDYKQIFGTLTGPLGDGVSARLTGLYLDRDSQVDFVSAKRAYVAPALKWEIAPGTSITGLAFYQYDRVNGDTNGFLPVLGTLQQNPLGQLPIGTNLGEPKYNFYRRNQFALGYEFRHDFGGGITFEQNLKWFQYKELQHVIYGGYMVDNRTVGRFNFPYRENAYEFAVDNRISARFATGAIEHNVIVGLDYRNYRDEAEFGFAGATNIDIFNPVYSDGPFTTPAFQPYNHQRLRQTGLYAQDMAKLGSLIFTLSGRQDWTSRRDYNFGGDGKQNRFTYRAGATYVTESGVAPYVSYATSFQPVLGTDLTTGKPFEPSTGNQIEGGLKFDGRTLNDNVHIFATVAGYRIRQNNVTLNAGSQATTNIQARQAQVQGIEFEAVARIRNQLSFNLSYTYTDSEIRRTIVGGPPVGAQLPTTPRHKASALVDYTLQRGALGGLGFGAGVRYVGSSPGSIIGPFTSVIYDNDATTLFDALIHYDLPKWRFAINGSNIFDKKYVGRCSGAVGCIYGQRAQIIGTISRKF